MTNVNGMHRFPPTRRPRLRRRTPRRHMTPASVAAAVDEHHTRCHRHSSHHSQRTTSHHRPQAPSVSESRRRLALLRHDSFNSKCSRNAPYQLQQHELTGSHAHHIPRLSAINSAPEAGDESHVSHFAAYPTARHTSTAGVLRTSPAWKKLGPNRQLVVGL